MNGPSQIKVGIAGLGRAGMNMHCDEMDKYPDKYKIVAGCDPDNSRRHVLKAKYVDCNTYVSLAEMVNDPEVELMPLTANIESPSLKAGFSNKEELKWIDKNIKVSPATKCDVAVIWEHLFAAVRGLAEFPIALEEGFEVAEIINRVKLGTEFA